MPNGRHILIGCLLGLVSAALTLALDATGALDGFEHDTWDLRVRTMAPRADVPIKLILLDQGSLDWADERNHWGWPWPRDVYGLVLGFCRRAQVKALAFDVVFLEPSRVDPAGDEEFAAAIAQTPQYIGALPTSSSGSGVPRWPRDMPPNPFHVEGLDRWLSLHPDAPIAATSASFAVPSIAKATRLRGHVRGAIDETDGVTRRVYPLQFFDGRAVPLFGLVPFLTGRGGGSAEPPPPMSIQGGDLVIGDRRLPMDDRGRTILNYYRPRGDSEPPFEAYPAAAVIASEAQILQGQPPTLSPQVFKDCYVFFGFSAPGLYDIQATPFSKNSPGIEVHATILANVMTGRIIAPAGRGAAWAYIVLWSVLCGAATTRGGGAWRLAAVAVLALATPVLAGVIAYKSLIWWPIIAPLLAAGVTVTAGIAYIYTTESSQRRFIRRAFGQYLSPTVIEHVVANPDALRLGGIDKELSIFFCDIEGFSKISEDLGASRVTRLLNEVLSELSRIILDEDGTLDKYVGDAVVAFWNAPTDQPDHAVRAVRAALRCKSRLSERREEFRELAGGCPVRVRFGLNIGEAVVGNLGSPQRFNYSMSGDAVNLASRLEGANKSLGTQGLATRALWDRTGGRFIGRDLGTLVVVGREAPVQVIEPLGMMGDARPTGFEEFQRALALCREGRMAEGIAILDALPDDPVARACLGYLRSLDPSQKWDGVWRLSAK